MNKKLIELLIVLKGPYSLEVCAGMNQNKPEDHPYITFLKKYGKVISITGWNLVHCELEEEWAHHKYHSLDHIYKNGDTILEKHNNRKDISSALEELNKKEEKIERKLPVLA